MAERRKSGKDRADTADFSAGPRQPKVVTIVTSAKPQEEPPKTDLSQPEGEGRREPRKKE